MMPTIRFQKESWTTTETSNIRSPKTLQDKKESTATYVSKKIINIENYLNLETTTPINFRTIEDLISKSESIQSRKTALEKARKRLSDSIGADNKNETIRSLRMANGWSQTHLAKMLGTSQSHIARIEKGTEDVRFATCRKLCEILNIDMNTLSNVILNQQQKFEIKTQNDSIS